MLVDNLAVTVLNLGDRHGIAMLATHGEGGVCLGHLKRRELLGAQRERRICIHLVVDAQVMAHIDHVLYAHGLRHLHVARVRRNLGRPRERNVTIGVVVVVAHLVRAVVEGLR